VGPSDLTCMCGIYHTGFRKFSEAATRGNFIPMFERLFSDSLTPVLAYRCLVKEDDRDAPSFLFESVTNGDQSVSAPHVVVEETRTRL
jgi:hypothetical protein